MAAIAQETRAHIYGKAKWQLECMILQPAAQVQSNTIAKEWLINGEHRNVYGCRLALGNIERVKLEKKSGKEQSSK